jgi:hypothetical protein
VEPAQRQSQRRRAAVLAGRPALNRLTLRGTYPGWVPRSNRRRVDPVPPARPTAGTERIEEFAGEPYVVRTVTGAAATKPYRCPGCDQEIRAGVAHLVCWPVGDDDAADRRHWHRSCWVARERRAPGVQRSRSAPRY